MTKTFSIFSIIALALLTVGTIFAPQSAAFWLASHSAVYDQVRIVLGAVLFLQLITRPPRHMAFRIVAGSIGVVIGIWAIEQTYSYNMQFLDTLSFLGSSLAVLVTSLERKSILSLTKPETSIQLSPTA